PALENAFAAQVAYEGVYDDPPSVLADDQHFNTPDGHGRETRVRAPRGFIISAGDCRDEGGLRPINEFGYTWFDFDCNYCTGVFVDQGNTGGKFLKRWNTAAPPPNPALNVGTAYNFTDNPARVVAPARDGSIVLAWDNLSETTVDPEKSDFDFRSYRVWKVSGWRRPVGSSGPADDDWALMNHFRFFDFADSNKELFSTQAMDSRFFFPSAYDSVANGHAVCPEVFVPNVSIRTVIVPKSRFATRDLAAGAVQALSTQLMSTQRILFPLKYAGTVNEDATSYRFVQADGDCKEGTAQTVGLNQQGDILAEVCQNSLAENLGFRVP